MSFKPVARRLNIILIALSQLTRTVKSWEEPDISNMKGGGAIEAVGDLAWLLWKESEDPKISQIDREAMEKSGEDNIIKSKIGKARNGIESGCSKYCKLISNKKTTSVREYTLEKPKEDVDK
jgi:replicative DNA helicase